MTSADSSWPMQNRAIAVHVCQQGKGRTDSATGTARQERQGPTRRSTERTQAIQLGGAHHLLLGICVQAAQQSRACAFLEFVRVGHTHARHVYVHRLIIKGKHFATLADVIAPELASRLLRRPRSVSLFQDAHVAKQQQASSKDLRSFRLPPPWHARSGEGQCPRLGNWPSPGYICSRLRFD
jgi:hypothetical protein